MKQTLRYVLILILSLPGAYFVAQTQTLGQPAAASKVLIVFEGADQTTNYGRGDAKQLANLLGHFSVEYRIEGVQSYKTGDMNGFDRIFYIGFSKKYDPPDRFLKDLFATEKSFIWMNTGFDKYCERYDIGGKYGFHFSNFDTTSNYSVVRANGKIFTKGEPNLNV